MCRKKFFKPDTSARQPVQVGGLDLRVAITSQSPSPLVIGQDHDNVGFLRACFRHKTFQSFSSSLYSTSYKTFDHVFLEEEEQDDHGNSTNDGNGVDQGPVIGQLTEITQGDTC